MCKIEDAMNELTKLGHKFLDVENELGKSRLEFSGSPNVWLPAPKIMEHSGILFSSCTDSTPSDIKGLSFMPSNTKVSIHEHASVIETLMVIQGKLHYQIFDSKENGGAIIEKGILDSCEKITFKPRERHILLTANKDTYLYVTFKKESNE